MGGVGGIRTPIARGASAASCRWKHDPGTSRTAERAVGVEPTLAEWKSVAFADRPGSHERTWWKPKGIEPSSHALQVRHLPVGTRPQFDRRASATTSRAMQLPRVAIRPQRSRDHVQPSVSIEQMGGVEPADFGVAHRCVTATLHLHGGPVRDRLLWIAVGAVGAFDNPYVGREGIEPSSRRSKSPLQSQRLLPTQSLPASRRALIKSFEARFDVRSEAWFHQTAHAAGGFIRGSGGNRTLVTAE